MKNRFSNINTKSLLIGFIVWVIILIIIVSIGYAVGSANTVIWPAIIVTQMAAALLWLIARIGGFSTFSHGMRGMGNSALNRKSKLGEFTDKERKETKKPFELEKEAKSKNKQGIIMMVILTVIETIIILPIIL
ncbi:MAG: hypothetical protein KAG91_01895 [Mycoplasmataceae bacterium]|nr:hypothetical protein [Mycoplasmataceae bacterium]